MAATSKWISVYNFAENILYFVDACSDEKTMAEAKKLLYEFASISNQDRMPLLVVGLNGHLPNARSADVLGEELGFPPDTPAASEALPSWLVHRAWGIMVVDPTLPVHSRVCEQLGPKFKFTLRLNSSLFDKVDMSMPLQWLAEHGKFVKRNCEYQ